MPAQTLRDDLDWLVVEAERDLSRLWTLADSAAVAEALRDVLPALVTEYGAAAATVAAFWYDDERERAGARGRFEGVPVEPGDRGAQALVGWALTEASDDATFRSLIVGGTQRRLTDHARQTVADSAAADPAARGWQRQARGGGCGFCQMLAGRGAVYRESTVAFGAHDHCHCVAVPAFDGQPLPVRPFTPSARAASDADRARARAWVADNL